MGSERRRKMEISETFASGEEIKPRDLFIPTDLRGRYQVMWPFRPNYLLRDKQGSCSEL